MLLLLLALLAFLFPLAVYCLFLAILNRRPLPVVLSGRWDCLGLLFACSGFLLVGGPAILSYLYHQNLLEAAGQHPPVSFEILWTKWWYLWAAYYALVIAGAGLLIWSRQNKTVIYNVDVDAFQHHFAHITRDLELRSVPRPGGWSLLPIAPASTGIIDLTSSREGIEGADGRPKPTEATGPATILDISSFPPLCHVTIHWRNAPPDLPRAFEEGLRKHVGLVCCLDNPAGSWLLGIAGLLFGVIFMLTALIFLVVLLPPRRPW